MEKMTYKELRNKIDEHNKENNIVSQYSDDNPLNCVIVFKNESWPERKADYPLEARSYQFRSDEKHFLPEMGGNSIFAETIDGSDHCRLDWYLYDWVIDYCYIQ